MALLNYTFRSEILDLNVTLNIIFYQNPFQKKKN